MRKWVAGLVAAAVVVGVVVVVLTQHAQDDAHAEDVARWHQELQGWEQTRVEALTPPEGSPLSEVVTGAAMTALPSQHPGPVADIDDVNAACTSLTAYAGAVDDAPGPPAAPADADFTGAERQRFEQDLQALQEFRTTIGPAGDLIRRFCGTYPLLITAHTDGGADPDGLVAQALGTQCPLAELAQACEELQATASGETAAPDLDAEHITGVITDELASAEQTISESAGKFHQRLQD